MPGGVEIRGREAYKKHVEGFVTPFPDFRCSREIMFSKGDYVVIRDICTGTHTGPGMGEPTGKKIRTSGIVIHRLAAGKMVECWLEVDSLNIMQQLGYKLVPPE
jgi:predicted ester cyclase